MGLSLAGLTLSCSTDSLPAGGQEGSLKYIRLTLNAPLPDTRTQVPDTPDSPEESRISSVNLYIVDEGGTSVQSLGRAVVVKIDEDTWEAYSYLPAEASAGSKYYLYVVANQGTATYDYSNWDALIGSVTASPGSDANSPQAPAWMWQPNRFLMTNTTNGAAAEGRMKAGVPFVIEEGTNPTEVTVSIERLAVKVEVDATEAKNGIDPAKCKLGVEEGKPECSVTGVKITRTALVNCVSQYNLIQHWGEAGNEFNDEVTTPTSVKWLFTPSSVLSYGIAGGYYNRLTVTTDANGNVTDGIDPALITGWTPANTEANATDKHFMYCLENNPPTWNTEFPDKAIGVAGTKSKGRTTAVVVEAQVEVSDPSQLTAGTVYRFGDKLYTSELAFRQEKYSDLSDAEFKAVLDALKASRAFQTLAGGKMYYTVYLLDDRYMHTEQGVAGDVSPSDRGSGTAGTPYYYYAVMRNSWNVVKINQILGWGDDKPTEPPTDPIDESKIGLATIVRANFWKIEERDHILGEGDVLTPGTP